ncbi:alpha/beta hydrolase [Vagococcus acidifermentans]|nr:alpha/beta hydrolase [Vagococcus acidifermentans]
MIQITTGIEHLAELETPRNTHLILDPLDGKPRPLVLICPGGGYRLISVEDEGRAIADWMHQLGYHAAVLAYQVLTINPVDFLNGLEQTMQHLRSLPYVSHIYVMGFSAGGHVAGLISTAIDTRPDGMMLSYPVVSIAGECAHCGSRDIFLGTSGEKAEDYSIERLVDRATPPAFIWHTAADPVVPVENSLTLARALSKNNIPFELHVFPEGGHALSISGDVPHTHQWKNLAENWLKMQSEKHGS